MWRVGAIIVVACAFVSCNSRKANSESAESLLPKVGISTAQDCADTVRLGVVGEGQTLMYNFAFVNTAQSPLTIIGCDTGCGCVSAEYPTKPIAEGGSAECKLLIHTDGRAGEWTHAVEFDLSAAKYRLVLQMTVK